MAPQRPKRRRIWLLVALSALVLLAGGTTWALTLGRQTTKRTLARSIRATVGRPAPQDPVPVPVPVPGTEATADVGAQPAATPQLPPPPPPQRPKHLRNVSFVLLLGVDATKRNITGRTDAVVVAGFRDRDGAVAAFSIPRDLWIEIPDYGPARINSVMRIGDVKMGGRGTELLREIIEREFGIRIDHHVAVDVNGFVEIVDHLGGLDVDVACPIRDCFWIDGTDQPCHPLDLEAGRQHVDGETALLYARSRHGRGDRDRTRRQQVVLLALGRRVEQAGLGGLRELWTLAEPYVRTDLDWEAAAYYASFALETPMSEVSGFSVKHPIVRRHVTEENKHVLVLDHERFDAALADMFGGRLPGVKGRRHCPDPDAALR